MADLGIIIPDGAVLCAPHAAYFFTPAGQLKTSLTLRFEIDWIKMPPLQIFSLFVGLALDKYRYVLVNCSNVHLFHKA